MNILVPYFVFALSFFPETWFPDNTMQENIYQTDVTIGAEIAEVFSIEGQIKTDMLKDGYFQPFQDEYYIRAFFEYNGFKIGAEHVCYHPVESAAWEVYQYGGGHNRIYFEFDTRRMK